MDITTNTETTIYSLAAEMASWFESRTRDNGHRFFTLKDGHADWMKHVCFEAHHSPIIGLIMPDDHRYEMVKECLDLIADCSNDDELEEAHWLELCAPDYTYDLLQWLASHNARAEFCDTDAEETGERSDLIGQIRNGYIYELREVFDLVVSALNTVFEGK